MDKIKVAIDSSHRTSIIQMVREEKRGKMVEEVEVAVNSDLNDQTDTRLMEEAPSGVMAVQLESTTTDTPKILTT